jgi:hypothetical protein
MPHYGLTQEGAALVHRADAVLTNAYNTSKTVYVDLKSYDSLTVAFIIGTGQAKTANIKFQWSLDDPSVTTPRWFDEQIDAYGTVSGTETPVTGTSRRTDLDMTSAGNIYIIRTRRLARFFRTVEKSDATTTGTLSIIVKPSVNCN